MPRLELRFLGPFQATLDGAPVTAFESDKVRALLAYLAVEADRPHPRDALAALLWPDRPDASARRNLRQALNNLRAAIADAHADPPFLLVSRGMLQFNVQSDYTLDVTELTALLDAVERHNHRRPAGCQPCLQRLSEAAALYCGDFLSGFFLSDRPEFDEWVLLTREALRQRALGSLYQLAQARTQRGEFELAAQLAHRQLEFDPWREEAHRQVMTALAAAGQRSAALAQFARCQSVLAAELGAEPSEPTRALYERIRDETFRVDALGASHNLPAETTSFVGREAELAQLSDYLSNPDCRLITLVGPGGIGKSRLALHAARQQRYAFADGVRYASLADVESNNLVAPVLADACGLQLSGDADPARQLVDFLRDQETLLLLDNFEHLLESATLVADILLAAPGVTCLVTSREPLRLQTEWLLAVGGLAFPANTPPATAAADYAAIRLFCERIAQRKPDFALDDSTAPATAHICRLVDGMPLALELAAAWAPRRPLVEITSEIEHNIDFLASRMRDAPERHRNMRAVFEHSWRLLTPDEQQAFRKLTIFRGGFTANAAEQVCGAATAILNDLHEKSLLQRAEGGRFSLHELLRQFGDEKLRAEGDGERLRDRHSRYYLRQLGAHESALCGGAQRAALDAITNELDNVRAAWEWATRRKQAADLDRALAALYLFFEMQGRAREGADLFRPAAEALQPTAADDPLWPLQARMAARAGALMWRTAQYDAAQALLDEAQERLRARGARAELAFALRKLGGISAERGEYAQAVALLEESLTLYRETGDRLGEAIALSSLGVVREMLGDREEAWDLHQESLRISRGLDNRWNMAAVLSNLGASAYGLGKLEQAREFFEASVEHHRAVEDKRGAAIALINLGDTLKELGRADEARRPLLEALQASREGGVRFAAAHALGTLGIVAVALKNAAEGREYFRAALRMAQEIQSTPTTLAHLADAAELLLLEGQPTLAVELLTCVQEHPASEQNSIDKAGHMLTQLEAQLGAEAFAATAARDLETLVAEFLAAPD